MDPVAGRLLRELDAVIAAGAPRALHLGGARPARRAPGDGPTAVEPFPRLLVGLAGEHRYRCSRDGERVDALLPRAHALYLASGAWSVPARRAPCRYLGLVFRPLTLRILVGEYGLGSGRPSFTWHHTRAPLGGAGAHALAALERLAEAPGGRDAAPALFAALLRLARAHLADDLVRPAREPAGAAHWRAAARIITERCGEPIGRADVARQLGINPTHLADICRAHGGTTFRATLTAARVAAATRLLRGTSLPLAEVARRCGLADAGHLVKTIRRALGTTPGRLRRGR